MNSPKLDTVQEVYDVMEKALRGVNEMEEDDESVVISSTYGGILKGIVGKMIAAGFQFTEENAATLATSRPAEFADAPFYDDLMKIMDRIDG